MSDGTCLCGKVTWSISGEPEYAFHCHCKMCRKSHGAGFATYYYLKSDQFEWTGSRDSIVDYASSEALVRSFCSDCGSVVPNEDNDKKHFFVPAGSHTDGAKPTDHIFTGSKASWIEITDDLKQHDAYPPGIDEPAMEDPPLDEAPDGVLRGGCLCGAVLFHQVEPFKVVHNCHCSRCRQARAAAHTTNGFTSANGIEFLQGEEHIKVYKVADAKFFSHAFCDICGSGLPRVDEKRKIAAVPLGALDDAPTSGPVDHIFTGSKADWYDITDDLPCFEEGPTNK